MSRGERDEKFSVDRTRVGREARELFWGFFSGTTLKPALRAGLAAFLVFSAAALTAIATGAGYAARLCRTGPVFEPPAECTSVTPEIVVLFLPAMFVLLLGSYLSNRRRREKIFQQSSLETAFVILFTLIALLRSGIEGLLAATLVTAAFLAMFFGYRLSFLPEKSG